MNQGKNKLGWRFLTLWVIQRLSLKQFSSMNVINDAIFMIVVFFNPIIGMNFFIKKMAPFISKLFRQPLFSISESLTK
jgi:hypothetical protein